MKHCLLSAGLMLCHAAWADTALPPVTVSAARTAEPGIDIPAAKTIVSRAEIDGRGARTLAELLHGIAGVHVSDATTDGGNATVDMRGFGSTASSNVAVLVDGRKLNPATDSATLYLNAIDLDDVEQIEIIHGSAGTLYGNQAVGGLINIVTRNPERHTRRARLGAGSYDTLDLQAGISDALSPGIAVDIQAARRVSDNYREHNASRLERVDGRVQFDHADGYGYLDLQWLHDFLETPGALFPSELAADRRQAVFPADFLETESRLLRLGANQGLGPHWRFEGEIALRDDHRDFVQSFRGFPGSPSTQDRESIEITPRLVGRYGDRVLTIGADYLSTDYRLLTAFGPQGNDQSIAAVYAQLAQPLSPTLSTTIGIRHARVDNAIDNGGTAVDIDDAVTAGSLGIVYRPDAAWRLFVRADQNHRFAKVDEHTNVPFGQPVGLDTQRGISYETGAEYRHDAGRLSMSLYHLRLKDEISFDAVSFTNVNLPQSRRNGATLSADTRLSGSLHLGAAFDYIDAEITSGTHTGSRVPLVPETRLTAFAAYQPTYDLQWRLDIEHVGEQFLGADFSNTAQPLAAYTVANLTGHYDLGDWRLTFKVRNLFDARYSETGSSSFAGDGFNPAPERHFWISASYRFEE